VNASLSHEAAGGRAHLVLEQDVPPTPSQSAKKPMPIPLKIALFGERTGEKLAERLIVLEEQRQELTLEGVGERPVLSINRDFSAPVIVEAELSREDLAFLSARDDNPFARYEAMQQLMLGTLVEAISGAEPDHRPVIDAVRETLSNPDLDSSFIAEAVLLPTEAFIGDQMRVVDPEAIHSAREALRADLGQELESLWRDAYSSNAANRFEYSHAAKGARRLRTVALGYLTAAGAKEAPAMAMSQFSQADNMTDRQGALGVLANSDAAERAEALAAFYQRYKDNALVLDKWFTVQGLSTRADTLEAVKALAEHPDFTLTNPNRMRALVGALASNQRAFHDASGGGYRFLADMILAVDRINPQSAARQVPPLGRWRRFDEGRAALMRAELQRIVDTPGLSKDVFEQASKSLA
jgi:aminopeptidase N